MFNQKTYKTVGVNQPIISTVFSYNLSTSTTTFLVSILINRNTKPMQIKSIIALIIRNKTDEDNTDLTTICKL